MDLRLQNILERHCNEIVASVTSPCDLFPLLVECLTQDHIQRIRRCYLNEGGNSAVMELYMTILKRGNRGFFIFAEALHWHKCVDLVMKLLKDVPLNLLTYCESPSRLNNVLDVVEKLHGPRSDITPTPGKTSGSIGYQFQKDNDGTRGAAVDVSEPNLYVNQGDKPGTEPNDSTGNKKSLLVEPTDKRLSLGLTDCISSISAKDIRHFCDELNAEGVLYRDWRGIADAMKVSVDSQRKLRKSSNSMEDLFQEMRYACYTIQDFAKILEVIERRDLLKYLHDKVIVSGHEDAAHPGVVMASHSQSVVPADSEHHDASSMGSDELPMVDSREARIQSGIVGGDAHEQQTSQLDAMESDDSSWDSANHSIKQDFPLQAYGNSAASDESDQYGTPPEELLAELEARDTCSARYDALGAKKEASLYGVTTDDTDSGQILMQDSSAWLEPSFDHAPSEEQEACTEAGTSNNVTINSGYPMQETVNPVHSKGEVKPNQT